MKRTIHKAQSSLFSHTPVFSIRLVKERDFDSTPITTPQDAARLLAEFLRDSDRERFVVLMLATSGACIGINVVSVGTLSASLVSARETFKPPLLSQAASIVLGHNHPSGRLEPSREDIAVTKKLVEAGRLLDIPVRDHVIVGHDGAFTSLAERGLM